jgi:ATP-binding cassette subfamily F protein 3
MSLVIAAGVEKSFGANTVLRDVSLRLEWGQRVGLVGPNGSGKTTLLRIVEGDLEPDRGYVRRAHGLRCGYLRQEQVVASGRTVFQEAEAAFAPVLAMEARLRALEHAMAAHAEDTLDPLLAEYGSLHDRFEAMGGFDSLRDIHKILKRIGFSESDLDRPTAHLSGGQKTRLALARLLLSGPDVLLLDEPTNHLDLEATEWLEEFLTTFGGALILVSHDRRFLDAVATSITEIDGGALTHYRSRFSAYWEERARRVAQAATLAERRDEEVARLEDFWRRNKAGQNRNMAWSRLKAAQKLRQQNIQGPQDLDHLKVSLKSSQRSGNEVVIADRLDKSYGARAILTDVSLLITRGQRIGIVGPNGSGKSTLLRLIVGEEPPTSGRVRLGASVTLGYFAQEASGLDPDLSVLDSLLQVRDLLPGEARGFLARFLFRGDEVFRTVAMLSGGEKNRLMLAQLVLDRPNLLILDEPTNHLDLIARDALAGMLRAYDGTLLLASHDRYLLDETTTHTLSMADGRAILYDGSYTTAKQAAAKGASRSVPRTAGGSSHVAANRPMNSFELTRARKKAAAAVADAERRVAVAEDWLKRIEECLSRPEPGDDMVRLARDHTVGQEDLARAMAEWEGAVMQAEELGLPL